MKVTIFLTLILVFVSSNTINLNSSPEIDLIYSFPSSDTIELTLQFYTQGYISIGFGSSMADSQIYLAYKNSTNDFIVESTHASGHKVPTADSNQNVVFISGSRDSSKTIVTFQRKLNTGDSNDVAIVPGSSIPLIWAYGDDDTIKHHIAHGHTDVTFELSNSNSVVYVSRFQGLVNKHLDKHTHDDHDGHHH